MQKKFIVRLTDEERESLRSVIKKLNGSSEKVRRAQVLLKADADGPDWTGLTRELPRLSPVARRRSRTFASGWSMWDLTSC